MFNHNIQSTDPDSVWVSYSPRSRKALLTWRYFTCSGMVLPIISWKISPLCVLQLSGVVLSIYNQRELCHRKIIILKHLYSKPVKHNFLVSFQLFFMTLTVSSMAYIDSKVTEPQGQRALPALGYSWAPHFSCFTLSFDQIITRYEPHTIPQCIPQHWNLLAYNNLLQCPTTKLVSVVRGNSRMFWACELSGHNWILIKTGRVYFVLPDNLHKCDKACQLVVSYRCHVFQF